MRNSHQTRRGLWTSALLATAIGLGTVTSPVAAAAPVDTVDTSSIVSSRAGDAAIVDPDKPGVALTRGGSSTEFSFELPDAAECPGDSEHDSWRVQTFLVPADVDPGTIEYALGPTGAGQYAVYDTFTGPYVDAVTIPNDGPGEPGRINSFPRMNFAVFPPGELADGTYRIGVACSYFSATANYWDTEIVITSAPDDEPAQLAWRLASEPEGGAGTSNGSGFPWLAVASVVVIGALASALLVRSRNRRIAPNTRSAPNTVSLSKEPQ